MTAGLTFTLISVEPGGSGESPFFGLKAQEPDVAIVHVRDRFGPDAAIRISHWATFSERYMAKAGSWSAVVTLATEDVGNQFDFIDTELHDPILAAQRFMECRYPARGHLFTAEHYRQGHCSEYYGNGSGLLAELAPVSPEDSEATTVRSRSVKASLVVNGVWRFTLTTADTIPSRGSAPLVGHYCKPEQLTQSIERAIVGSADDETIHIDGFDYIINWHNNNWFEIVIDEYHGDEFEQMVETIPGFVYAPNPADTRALLVRAIEDYCATEDFRCVAAA